MAVYRVLVMAASRVLVMPAVYRVRVMPASRERPHTLVAEGLLH